MRGVLRFGFLAAATLAGIAGAAQAQTPAPDSGMVVERLQSGFTVAPVVKAGTVDGDTALLAGGEAGWVFDQHLFVGGGGFGQTNAPRGASFGYGGAVVEWRFLAADAPIRFGVKTLVGGGSATLPYSVNLPVFTQAGAPALPGGRGPTGPQSGPAQAAQTSLRTRQFLVREDVFVAEPALTLAIRLGRLAHVSAEAGYRYTANTRLLGDRLSGASAGVSVHFGGW